MSNCSQMYIKMGIIVIICDDYHNNGQLLSSEAMHQRVLWCGISDITNHSTDIYLSVLGR